MICFHSDRHWADGRREVADGTTPYGKADECDLILNGYVAFLDPPKETAMSAIKDLQGYGVLVKVLTGDNDLVARKICKEVGLSTEFVLLGDELEKMTDQQLADAAENTTLFARVSPARKQRIVKALQSRKHTVGYMGDGINDAPSSHAADVGISVDTAVDIAKESADMILLEKSLWVLDEGVLEGRAGFLRHYQVRSHGRVEQLRQHVQRLGASFRALPADAAVEFWRTTCSTTLARPPSYGRSELPRAATVLASSVFSTAPSARWLEYLRRRYGSTVQVGGSGVDLRLRLAREIEALAPDYSLCVRGKLSPYSPTISIGRMRNSLSVPRRGMRPYAVSLLAVVHR